MDQRIESKDEGSSSTSFIVDKASKALRLSANTKKKIKKLTKKKTNSKQNPYKPEKLSNEDLNNSEDDNNKEANNEGENNKEVNSRGDKTKEVNSRGDKIEEVKSRGDKTEEVNSRGDKTKEVNSRGDKTEEVKKSKIHNKTLLETKRRPRSASVGGREEFKEEVSIKKVPPFYNKKSDNEDQILPINSPQSNNTPILPSSQISLDFEKFSFLLTHFFFPPLLLYTSLFTALLSNTVSGKNGCFFVVCVIVVVVFTRFAHIFLPNASTQVLQVLSLLFSGG